MRLSPDGALYFLVEEGLPMVLLNYFSADLVILSAEDAFRTDGMIPALIADLFPVDEHSDALDYNIERFGHRLIQCPGNPSQGLTRF